MNLLPLCLTTTGPASHDAAAGRFERILERRGCGVNEYREEKCASQHKFPKMGQAG